MRQIQHDQFSELVERCYQVALEPETLPDMMLSLRDALGAHNVTFGRYSYVNGSADVDVFCTMSFSEDWRNDVMARDYNDPDNNIGFKMLLAAEPGTVACSEEYISLKLLKKQGFYHDILRPLGIGVTTAMTLTRNRDKGSGLFYQLGKDQLPEPDGDLALANRIAPHLQRSAQIMELVGRSEASAFSLENFMREQDFGVVLLDDQGDILFMNEAAQIHAREQDAILVRNGKLIASRNADRASLSKKLAAAVATGIGKGFNPGVELLLSRASGKRPLNCVVAPMITNAPLVPIRRPAAMVILKDPENLPQNNIDKMARIYRLSERQATIGTLLLEGKSVSEISEQLSISPNTLKTHLRRLYEKVDCRNRADFAGLINRGL